MVHDNHAVAVTARRNDMKTLFEQIEASSKIADIDDAVRPIQDILGQDDGGLAAQFFSGNSEFWEHYSSHARKHWLIRYCVFELRHKEMAL
jgi:hypothetical protein